MSESDPYRHARQDQHYAQVTPARGNGMAVAGFCTGLIGFLLSWTVFLGIILGTLGVIFGALGLSRARDPGVPHRKLAVAGTVLGVLAILVSIAMVVFSIGEFWFNVQIDG